MGEGVVGVVDESLPDNSVVIVLLLLFGMPAFDPFTGDLVVVDPLTTGPLINDVLVDDLVILTADRLRLRRWRYCSSYRRFNYCVEKVLQPI